MVPTTPTPRSMPSSKLNRRSSTQIRVVVRVRPFLPSELESAEGRLVPCVSVVSGDADCRSGEEITVHIKDQWTSRNECYKLDSFFGQDNGLDSIFNGEVRNLVSGVSQGLNATVFAYGATGSGKTYTMQGTDSQPGLIPLSMSTILSSCLEDSGCSIEIAYYEVYLDRCYDLLEPKAKEIMVLEDKDGQVQMKGLSKVKVSSMTEFSQIFSSGIQRRKIAHTGLNDVSSRSHAVLSIILSRSGISGKLNLIDLAGNEDNRRTGNEGIRLLESSKINQSLLSLSNVIYALNNNESRIPYRESKLTRILQDSLGGTSRALMIACLNPTSYHEAVRTVSLAARSRHVANHAREETPKVKVDMEAKLREWLESKSKTKSGIFTPISGRTCATLGSKKFSSARPASRVMIKDHGFAVKGRKLFDLGTTVLPVQEKYSLSRVSSVTNGVAFSEEGSLHGEEVVAGNEFSSTYIGEDLDVEPSQEARSVEVHNEDHETSTCNVSSDSCTHHLHQQTKPSEDVPADSSDASMPDLSADKENADVNYSPRTPKTPYEAGTPLQRFTALSSKLKDSLVQEYLEFLNSASRDELLALKGIGQKRAEYILELREGTPRPLKTLNDLEKIGLSSKQVHNIFRGTARGIFG